MVIDAPLAVVFALVPVFPSKPFVASSPLPKLPELTLALLLHTVPLLGLFVGAEVSYFLGLQVPVSGSVNPKLSGVSACPSIR